MKLPCCSTLEDEAAMLRHSGHSVALWPMKMLCCCIVADEAAMLGLMADEAAKLRHSGK